MKREKSYLSMEGLVLEAPIFLGRIIPNTMGTRYRRQVCQSQEVDESMSIRVALADGLASITG